ncbi:MAG: TolC family protein [bacterium]|nr:TolC family protein [bacterium]
MRGAIILLAPLLAAGVAAPAPVEDEGTVIVSWGDCVREARVRNPDLASALAQVGQARAVRSRAASPLFPQIGTEMRSSRTDREGSDVTEAHSLALTGRQILFDGLKTPFEMGKAGEDLTASQYAYDVTSSNVRLRLRRAFIELLRAQELLGITEEIAGRRRQNLELVQLRYDAGREHRGSLLLSRADLAQAVYETAEAARAIVLGRRRLSKEMGRTHRLPLAAREDVALDAADRERPDFEGMADRNPLLQRLIAQREAARYGVRSATADFLPQVYGDIAATRAGGSWPPREDEWRLGVNLSYPLFEGRRRVSEVARTRAALSQAEEDERSGRDGVILTMEETWTLLQDAREQAGVQLEFLVAAVERSKIARAQYANGLINFDDWTIIEDALVRARKSFLNAVAAAELAEANWIQAQGYTLEDEPL